jgi:probable rRNA maturation factor
MKAAAEMVWNRQRRVPVDVAPLVHFAERARAELGFPADGVAVQLVSDAAMKRLNWKFRGKRGSTDVLSFPARLGQARERGPRRRGANVDGNEYVGDIAISPQMARRNARRDSRSLPDELRMLVLHGMIHLAGYDHETDQGQMQKLEAMLRRRLGLTSR